MSDEQLRRVLQVRVDDQDAIAPAQIEPRGQRELVAMVTGQIDGDQARVLRRQVAHHLPGAIPGAVIDQHDLIILADRRAGGHSQALVQGGQAFLFVEAGYDDRQRGHGCFWPPGLSTA